MDPRTCQAFATRLASIKGFHRHVFSYVPQTGSTNDDLKSDWALEQPHPRVLVAGHQTHGRGLYDRQWHDQPKEESNSHALLASFSWDQPLQEQTPGLPLSILAGLAVHHALEVFWTHRHRPWLKWPNDIWVENGKLCGILIESTPCPQEKRYAIGIGINLNNVLPLEKKEQNVVSLTDFDIQVSPLTLLETILIKWSEVQEISDTTLLKNDYHHRAGEFWTKQVRIELASGESFLAQPIDLADEGGLWIQDKKNERRLISDARRIFISTSLPQG